MEAQKVEVYIMMSGNYCSFNQVSLHVVYDITNDVKVGFGEDEKEKLAGWKFNGEGGGYTDVTKKSAVKIGDKYYVEL